MWAALVAALIPQLASAVLFTNQVQNIQARNVRTTLAVGTGVASGESYSFVNGAIRNQWSLGAGGQTGKAWIQFDLAGTWAKYGKANLADAQLWLWNQNGASRQFWVAGVADGAGLESWDMNTLTWSNAPANDYSTTNLAYAFDYSKCYGGTNLWMVVTGTQGIDVSTPSVSQGALYISTNSTSMVLPFLQSDTDGKVTIGISDGPFNSNQTIPIGTNGTYAADVLAPNGLPTRSSPTLRMVFDIRVALVGGGQYCGGPGLDVSLAGSDVGVDYRLYTNGLYAGQTIAGTGSGFSFGAKTTQATYTATASNTTTTAISPVLGDPVVILAPTAPSIAVQPTSFVAATNSVALFSATFDGDIATIAWYRNGVALTNGGHYSGTDTAQLKISPVLASDAATTANGYYCVATGICGNQAITTTNALTVQVARNLVWQGTPGNTWDIATSANWLNGASASVFNQGDNVLIDDTASNFAIDITNAYVAPGVITFTASTYGTPTTIGGIGAISGPNSSLLVSGTGKLQINNANSFNGGTTISDGWLILGANSAVGTNIITIAGPTPNYSVLEIKNSGSASSGTPGINVLQDSSLQLDAAGAYAGAILGPVTGTAGKTLTINALVAIPGDNVRFYGNSVCSNNIVFNINGANWASYQSGDAAYYGTISGSCVLYPRSGNTILNGQNTFTSTTLSAGNVGVGIDSSLPTYSPVGLGTITHDNAGDIGMYAVGGAHTIENPFAWNTSTNNRIFKFMGTNQLTMSGAFDLSVGGTAFVYNRIIQVDNTAPSIISGVIGVNGGASCGVTKTGNGALYLNAANTYTGPTTNSAGLLAGSGSVAGSVVVNTNAAIGGGTPASMGGTLTVGGNLNLVNGGGFFRVNRAGSVSDHVAVTGSIVNTGAGTITITNLGAPLQAGDTFLPFNGKSVSGGSSLKIAGAGVIWTNKLATGGGIQVVQVIPNYSTNISYSISGSTLTVSWPATHLGWVLQSQTNSLTVGIRTNWVTIPGTAGVISTNLPIVKGNPTVFYRLSTP